MEPWLIYVGAIVLIAITLWIVWPARTTDAVDATGQLEEVSAIPMTESVGSQRMPQNDRPGNQYSSGSADAAGGVYTAVDRIPEDSPAVATNAAPRWSSSMAGTDFSSPYATNDTKSLTRPRTLGLGAAALFSVGGAIGGAWLYARWQRERNKPINRLRRGARDVAGRLGERMPDVEDLPRAAPMSGAATALLLAALVASRALRRGSSPTERSEYVRDQASDILRESLREALGLGRETVERGRETVARETVARGRETLARGRETFERGRETVARGRESVARGREIARPRRPAIMGVGFGGLAILAGGTYLVWRLLRGGSAASSWSSPQTGG